MLQQPSKILTLFVILSSFLIILASGEDPASRRLWPAQVVASFMHSHAIDAENKVIGWGSDIDGLLLSGSTTRTPAFYPVYTDTTPVWIAKPAMVASGANHMLLLDLAGWVWSWGKNDFGQLGLGNNNDNFWVPSLVSTSRSVLNNKKVVSIGAGWGHSIAVDDKGVLYAWGKNDYGQLGDGTLTHRNLPVIIPTSGDWKGTKILKISVGYWHNLAQDETGALFAWGRNDDGQLGTTNYNNKNLLTKVDNTEFKNVNITAFSAGVSHSLAALADGTGLSWGYNGHGQLGDGMFMKRDYPSRIVMTRIQNVVGVSAGFSHSLAFNRDGQVFAWGSNWSQRLGQATSVNESSVPIPVANDASNPLFGRKITMISAGYDHSLASDGWFIYGWGSNTVGQLGQPTVADSVAIPIVVNCRPGFAGPNCLDNICYGIASSDKAVCSGGNGACIGPNNCQCKGGFAGKTCDYKMFPWNILDFLFGSNTFAVPAATSGIALLTLFAFCFGSCACFFAVVGCALTVFLLPSEVFSTVVGIFSTSKDVKKNANANATKASEQQPYKIQTTAEQK